MNYTWRMQPRTCAVRRLGVMAYEEAWALQARLAKYVAAGERPPTLLLLEHLHTITFGRRGQPQNLLWDEAELARRGVSVHWVDRGGDITYRAVNRAPESAQPLNGLTFPGKISTL